jgi:YVTN family beta-propeller protein
MQISRRFLRLIGVIGLVLGCQSPPATPRVPEVLATIDVGGFNAGGNVAVNQRTGQIYVLHSTHVNVLKGVNTVADLKTGYDYANGMAVDEAGNWIYITNLFSDTVTVIRNTQVVDNIATLGANPHAVAVEPNSYLAYIVSGYGKRVSGVKGDIEGNILILSGTQVVTNLNVGRLLLTHVVADPVGGYIYTGGISGTIAVIKGTEVLTKHEGIVIGGLGGPILAMGANPRTGEIYVLEGNGHVRRFRDGKLIDQVSVWKNRTSLRSLQVHPLTGDVYVTDAGLKQAIVLRDMKEIARLPVGSEPRKMAIDPLTGNIYVANARDDTITVINGTEVLSTIKVGWRPFGIGINPVNGWVYVANEGDGTVSVLGYSSTNYSSPTSTKAPPTPTKVPPTPTKASGIPSAPTRTPTTKPYP